MGERAPVYCQTSPQLCRLDDVYLGEAHPGMKIRCPVCGRYTVAGQLEPLTQQSSTSRPWRNTGIDF